MASSSSSGAAASSRPLRSVLVFGANGTIGYAVARSFAAGGWRVFGVVRRASSAGALAAQEIIPVVGTPAEASSFLPALRAQTSTLSVIVNTTEDIAHYKAHFDAVVSTMHAVAAAIPAPEDGGGPSGRRKPLVLWSSGCKDYGMTGLHGAAGLAPHTEDSALASPPALRLRTEHSLELIRDARHLAAFDAAVLRPTTVYGRGGSFYADAFERAAAAAAMANKTLVIPASPDAIMHGTHVDDVGDAYLALARTWEQGSDAVAGRCFNISGRRYETAGEVAEALKVEYGLSGVEYAPEPGTELTAWANTLWAFSQWVGSERVRSVTGWKDTRALFSENLKAYRIAYEAAKEAGDEGVARMARLQAALRSGRSRESIDKSGGE